MALLRQRMTEEMQIRNQSTRTQDTYVQHVGTFAQFNLSPELLGTSSGAIRRYRNLRFCFAAEQGICATPQ